MNYKHCSDFKYSDWLTNTNLIKFVILLCEGKINQVKALD